MAPAKAKPPAHLIAPQTADLDNDFDVDFSDYATLAVRWLKTDCSQPDWCFGCDLNHSGLVDYHDLHILADSCLCG